MRDIGERFERDLREIERDLREIESDLESLRCVEWEVFIDEFGSKKWGKNGGRL